MKAAVLRAPGGLDRIEVQDIPDPGQPGPGQIRIALHATSLNYHDLWSPMAASRPLTVGY
jgi:NADPH:quinone reductase-like Zn-dependent oxidoreductase